MWQRYLAFGIAAIAVIGTIALAQNSDNSPERYSIEKRDGSMVRVDKTTGAVSFCNITNSNIVCRLGADERAAYEAEIENLGQRIAVLEKKIGQSPTKTKRPSEDVPGSVREQSKLDKEFNRAMDFAETAMRRFFGIVQDLKNDFQDNKT